MQMAAIVCAVVALLCLGSVSGQPTNANPGQTPIVTGGAVLPDNTFVASTWAQVAGQWRANIRGLLEDESGRMHVEAQDPQQLQLISLGLSELSSQQSSILLTGCST
jgi:hypothetical protein